MFNRIEKLFQNRFISVLAKTSTYCSTAPTNCSSESPKLYSDLARRLLQMDGKCPTHQKRLAILGQSFCDYAVAVKIFISNNDSPSPSELDKLRKKCLSDTRKQFRQHKLIEQEQTVPSIEVVNRFKSLNIPAEYWNIAAFENINEMTDEDLQLLVNWRVNVVQFDSDEREEMCQEILGAYLTENQSRQALLFLAWLNIPVLSLTRNSSNEFKYGKWTVPSTDDKFEMESKVVDYSSVEETIGYSFSNRKYLLEALAPLTHSSATTNALVLRNKRLSFLGKIVSFYTTIRYILEHSTGNNCVMIKDTVVSDSVIADVIVRDDWKNYSRFITKHLKYQTLKNFEVNLDAGVFNDGKRNVVLEQPKILTTLFEALLGAVYLDSNLSDDAVWRVVTKITGTELRTYSNTDSQIGGRSI